MSKLLVELAPSPRVFFLAEPEVATFLKTEGLSATQLGDWTGFYDWLRSAPDKIIGVRYWPFEQTGFLLERVLSTKNLRVDSNRSLCVFFSTATSFLEELSGDQAFEEAQLLARNTDQYSLLLGCSKLTPAELENLISMVGSAK